jgi:hypothetical protein
MTTTNPRSTVANRTGPAARFVHLIVVRTGTPGPAGGRDRSARVAIIAFAVAFLGLSALVLLALDDARLRDPEYGRREANLKARLAEHPGRPLVLVLGSSRAAMGVCPAAWEETRPGGPADPLVFNMALLGGGPVMQLLVLKRVLAAGVRPAAVVVEYWPAFLREDGPYEEAARIDPTRLGPGDRELVRDYFPDPAATAETIRKARRNPVSGFRRRFVSLVAPSWLPWDKRQDLAWHGLDRWGWLPGLEDDPTAAAANRAARLAQCGTVYHRQFADHRIHPTADRALREVVATARGHGAKVAFAFLPEATEFRGWYPAGVERAAREHLTGLCRELVVPLIDAREWMPDGSMTDGFHLSRSGAAAFTRRLVPAVAAALPDLGGRP